MQMHLKDTWRIFCAELALLSFQLFNTLRINKTFPYITKFKSNWSLSNLSVNRIPN